MASRGEYGNRDCREERKIGQQVSGAFEGGKGVNGRARGATDSEPGTAKEWRAHNTARLR